MGRAFGGGARIGPVKAAGLGRGRKMPGHATAWVGAGLGVVHNAEQGARRGSEPNRGGVWPEGLGMHVLVCISAAGHEEKPETGPYSTRRSAYRTVRETVLRGASCAAHSAGHGAVWDGARPWPSGEDAACGIEAVRGARTLCFHRPTWHGGCWLWLGLASQCRVVLGNYRGVGSERKIG